MKSSDVLLNVRLCFYTIAFIHLAVAASIIFAIDMSGDSDPRISAYTFVRFKLITCWFNVIALVYLPVCIFCDFREKQGRRNERQVMTIRKIKDVVMTSIIFPTVMFADILFWRLWNKDRTLLGPSRIFEYLPGWANHSMHTVSMVMVLLDLALVPRRRPASLLPHLATMTAFIATYSIVMFWSIYNGEMVYPFIEIFDRHKMILMFVYTYIDHLFYFIVQWFIIDLRWGRAPTRGAITRYHKTK